MTTSVAILPWSGSEALASQVARHLGAGMASLEHDRFPDGESRVRVMAAQETTVLVAALDRPDPKLVPLLLAADAARGSGATEVGLIAPYLPYMRQDRRFRTGEPLSAALLGRVLALGFDWLVTLEPHLHRIHDLAEVVPMRCVAGNVTEQLASWIRAHAPRVTCIGPDEESEQWVAAVARSAGVEHAVFRKVRRGDRDVHVHAPDLSGLETRRAVLIDDILSSGLTLVDATRRLREQGVEVIACLAVHAIFADGAEQSLVEANLRVVTCDGIAHHTNGVPVAARLAELARPFVEAGTGRP